MKASKQSVATAKRLRQLRESRGVRQKFIADKIGIASPILCLLERGEKEWTPELVQKYEEALA